MRTIQISCFDPYIRCCAADYEKSGITAFWGYQPLINIPVDDTVTSRPLRDGPAPMRVPGRRSRDAPKGEF